MMKRKKDVFLKLTGHFQEVSKNVMHIIHIRIYHAY